MLCTELPHHSSKPEDRTHLILGGIAGKVTEWYDFALYGYFASIIGKQFFPAEDPTVSTIAAFGAFAAGFLARPPGGRGIRRSGETFLQVLHDHDVDAARLGFLRIEKASVG